MTFIDPNPIAFDIGLIKNRDGIIGQLLTTQRDSVDKPLPPIEQLGHLGNIR